MAFDTITGAAASTATTFGGAALNKVANWLNGGGSEVATVYDDDLKIVDPADSSKTIRQFNWATPANWDAGTVKFKLYWTTTGGSSAQTIDFDLAGVAFANDNPMDTAVGTPQNVTDTWIADDDLHVTSYSSAITIAGSPAAGELVVFQLSRDVAADDLGVDAEVVGVLLEYSTDASNSS
jgi:hypothetical protein